MKITPLDLLNYLIGMIACGFSFLAVIWTLFKPGEQNKEDMWDNHFGLSDPSRRMVMAWARIGWEWKDFFHDRKNVVVEHCRLHPQRWVKAVLFLWLAREALGLTL